MAEHPVVVATRRLHSVITGAPAFEKVTVDLGPLPGATQALDSVAIGLSLDDVAAISGATEYEGLAMQHETFDINCLVQSLSGDGDPLGRLARCFELFEAVGAAVMADDEDESITWGRISRHQTQWVETDSRMSGALLVFPVSVEAYRIATTG